jgi:glycine cleavage system H protein
MMADTKYTKDHEVVHIEDGNVAVLGITAYAQDALGDLVFVELPEVGASFEKGDEFAVVESVKTAAEVYTPVSGEIVEINDRLNDEPEAIKISLEEGWIAKIRMTDDSELDALMDEAAYNEYLETLD